jgi:hypothetical protein
VLCCELFVSEPLFDKAQLEQLHSIINGTLPAWSIKLRARQDEDFGKIAFVGRDGRLYDCIHEVAPPRRHFSHADLAGTYPGLSFLLSHGEATHVPESNHIAIEILDLVDLEGKHAAACMQVVFESLVGRLPVHYGNAHTQEEFSAKNVIEDETSVQAIGRLLSKSLPGLYWLNYFGPIYVDLIGRQRLLSAPAYEVKPVGNGILLALDASPDNWQSAAYRAREQATIAHLGKQYFFSRDDPDRPTIAPNFEA